MKQDTAKARNAAVSVGAAMLGLFQIATHNGLFSVNAGTYKRGYSVRKKYPRDSKRERQRRWLADAHDQQRNSHKIGTVQPAHIFGVAA